MINITKLLNNVLDSLANESFNNQIAIEDVRSNLPTRELLPAFLEENNYINHDNPLEEASGVMEYLDIDLSVPTNEKDIKLRSLPSISDNLDYLIIRLKVKPEQLKKKGINFKLFLPK